MSVYSRGGQRRRLSAAGRLAAASGNHSGNHAQVPIEDLKSVAQSLAPPQFFAAGEYHVLDRAAAALLGNGVERCVVGVAEHRRSEEHTSELQSLMRISYAVFCLKKKNTTSNKTIQQPDRIQNETT